MRATDGNTAKIYVRPDLTPAQLELDKKLRQELLTKGKDKFKIHRGKIVPRTEPDGTVAHTPDSAPIPGTSVTGSSCSSTTSPAAGHSSDRSENPATEASAQQMEMVLSTTTATSEKSLRSAHNPVNTTPANKEVTTQLSTASTAPRTGCTPSVDGKASPSSRTTSVSKPPTKGVSSQRNTASKVKSTA